MKKVVLLSLSLSLLITNLVCGNFTPKEYREQKRTRDQQYKNYQSRKKNNQRSQKNFKRTKGLSNYYQKNH